MTTKTANRIADVLARTFFAVLVVGSTLFLASSQR
jgi:hypothetical protein